MPPWPIQLLAVNVRPASRGSEAGAANLIAPARSTVSTRELAVMFQVLAPSMLTSVGSIQPVRLAPFFRLRLVPRVPTMLLNS
ncbi:hypothetical protein D9M71_670710 [compost metagenome]